MKAIFNPCRLSGFVSAPPSKSMAHRYLIGAALSQEKCILTGVDYSEDILASIDCLKALGSKITIDNDMVTIESGNFMQEDHPVLECRESGSTLRFFIPLALCMGKMITFKGSERLFERPLDIYEDLCREKGFVFKKGTDFVTVCGTLKDGEYKIPGNISSQFITGLIFALVYLNNDSSIKIIPPFESRPYVDLTISALKSFGADVMFVDEYTIQIKKARLNSFVGKIEGDYSNAAFLDAFNLIGGMVQVDGLKEDSLQGDKIYREYYQLLQQSNNYYLHLLLMKHFQLLLIQ